jgi:hypothetical protein
VAGRLGEGCRLRRGTRGPAPEHPLLKFGTAYVRRLTSAGPYTQTEYVQQLTSLNGWLMAATYTVAASRTVISSSTGAFYRTRARLGWSIGERLPQTEPTATPVDRRASVLEFVGRSGYGQAQVQPSPQEVECHGR